MSMRDFPQKWKLYALMIECKEIKTAINISIVILLL